MAERHTQQRDDMPDETVHGAFRGIIRAYGLLNRAMQPFFARYGITPSQWGVLRVLDRARQDGQGLLRMADVGQRLLIRPPSVTGVVDRLEHQGLLRRCTSPGDLRTKEVCLTAAGEELVERILVKINEHVRTVMSGLGGNEKVELVALLGRFIERLETVVNDIDAVQKQK